MRHWEEALNGTGEGLFICEDFNPPRISLLMVTRKVLGVRLDPKRTLLEKLTNVSEKNN